MALDLNLGSAFNATVNFAVAPWKAGALKPTDQSPGLVKTSDVFSPINKPANVKITNTRIPNVYTTLAKGTIPIQNQAQNTSGQSIFIEVTAVASETVGTVEYLVPVVARLEFRIPNYGSVTDANIQQLVLAALAAGCDSAGAPRFTQMMRGVLLP